MEREDPRPRVRVHHGAPVVLGYRCAGCGSSWAVDVVRCPRCRALTDEAMFGPEGTVWSSTVVRVDLPGRPAPAGLVYVDLDDGPRVLAHVTDHARPMNVGTRVVLTGLNRQGDLEVIPG